MRSAVTAFAEDDAAAARDVMAMKDQISRMDAECHARQVQAMREQQGVPHIAAYTLQSDIRENLKRIYYHAKRVAKLQARVENAAAWSSTTAPKAKPVPLKTVAARAGS